MVALLPSLLGLGEGDLVAHPAAAYPTYDVGARLAGATPVPTDDPVALLAGPDADRVRLVWLNSPGNPDGRVLGVEQLRAVVRAARAVQARSDRLRRVLRRAAVGAAVGRPGRAQRAGPAGGRG
jgi:aspartate/methionine/tyrosine aminotransferase